MSSSLIPTAVLRESRAARTLAALGRRALLGELARIHDGELTILENGRRHAFGRRAADGLRATIEVRDPRFWADVAFGGTVGAGESYIHGAWGVDDLTTLVRLMIRNRDAMNGLEDGLAKFTAPLRRGLHWLHRNSRAGSRRNIAAHYDLGNDFFRLMLDESMADSCAIYPRPGATLAEAQLTKFETICRSLDLKAGETLLEIGTGWGGLAMHAARHYGCHVTTTTISAEQHAYAAAAIERAGLSGSVTLLREDYRDLKGSYDKLVSVEMIEAVGHRYLDGYFAACSRLLKPSGAMLLQAITIQDQLYTQALRTVDFIQRFVFPGGFLPAVSSMLDSIRRTTDMKLFHLADIGPHYATTLADWRRNFHAQLGAVRAQGYPDSFVRLWDYYLSYCEGGFIERQLGDVQMLLTKPDCRRLPITA
jgi:cyclopropane-fatty-acyl-phospholipid synthase